MTINQMIELLEHIRDEENGDLELDININGKGTKNHDIENGVLVIENYGK